MAARQTLAFYEPGHFHAALTLRVANPRISENVHVYAAPGPDRDKFLALVNAFNTRAENPTSWVVTTHGNGGAAEQLDALLSDGLATVVVLAGKNDSKMATIARLTAAGIHCLGDKPWVTSLAALPALEAATPVPASATALAMDIMTNKHDLVAKLRREIVRDPALFGGFRLDASPAAIEIGSVHHLAKLVNGSPLQRPAWYYNVGVQGNGLVDITSHMVDQVQWLLEEEGRLYDFDTDVQLKRAETYDTEVPLSLFTDSTGADAFPASLAHLVRPSEPAGSGPLWAGGDGCDVLPLAANGVLEYSLRGVSAKHSAEWRPREPEGGGDLHSATLRGNLAEIRVGCGPETGYRTRLTLHPAASVDAAEFGQALEAAVAKWSATPQFAGVEVLPLPPSDDGAGWVVSIPPEIAPTHEEHFAMVLEEFLDHISGEGGGAWPGALPAAIRMRYSLLAHAHALGEA